MRSRRLVLALGAIVSGLIATAGIAMADDEVHGGHCNYGDFSVNIYPNCNGSNTHVQPTPIPIPVTVPPTTFTSTPPFP